MCCTTGDLTAEFTTLLQTTPKFLNARLIGLGFGQGCGRCGGSGQYSYCSMYGTTCFKCAGAGQLAPKLTKKLLAAVQVAVEDGRLEAYLVALKARNRNSAIAKKASNTAFSLWASQPTQVQFKAEKRRWDEKSVMSRMVGIINSLCSDVHKVVQTIGFAIQFPKTKGVISLNGKLCRFDDDALAQLVSVIEAAHKIMETAEADLRAAGFDGSVEVEYGHMTPGLREYVAARVESLGFDGLIASLEIPENK